MDCGFTDRKGRRRIGNWLADRKVRRSIDTGQ
jgi:hypothetical protein